MKSRLVFLFVLGLLMMVLILPTAAWAHGSRIEYTVDTTIRIVAEFDGGDPMDGAQVSVFAPSDLDNPWLVGECDDDGRFSFIPDVSIPGTWDITVRKAGHGDMIHIMIEEGAVTGGSGGSDLSTGQIALMSVCVIWGLIGTGLYFRRRRS